MLYLIRLPGFASSRTRDLLMQTNSVAVHNMIYVENFENFVVRMPELFLLTFFGRDSKTSYTPNRNRF